MQHLNCGDPTQVLRKEAWKNSYFFSFLLVHKPPGAVVCVMFENKTAP